MLLRHLESRTAFSQAATRLRQFGRSILTAASRPLTSRMLVAGIVSLVCVQAQTPTIWSPVASVLAAEPPALIPPTLTQSIQDTTALVGDKITLRVKAAGSKPLSYQWFKDDVAIAGQTRSQLAFSALTVSDGGKYTVVVSNSAGSPATANAQLNVVVPQLSLGLQANSIMIQQGVTAPMNISVGRTPGYKKAVKLAVSGLPSGVTGSFSPSSLGATKSASVLRLAVSGSAPVGTYLATVRATAPGATDAEASFTLYIQSAPPVDVAAFTTVQPWGTETALEMETTNKGVYVRTEDASDTNIVWRGTSSWTHWDFEEYLFSWRPSNLYNEAPSEFNVAWVGTDHFGVAIMNTGIPPFTYDGSAIMQGGELPIVHIADYLPGAKDWAISGQGGIFFDASNGGNTAATMFDYVDQIQNISVALRDPADERLTLYVGGWQRVCEVTPFETIEHDLSVFGTDRYVNKLDHVAGRLWIAYGGKVLTLKDGVVSQFADAATPFSGFGLDNFCIANGQLYASNGLRYPLTGGAGVPWLVKDVSKLRPGSPEFDRYLALLPMTSGAQLYALKNVVGSQIYALHDNRLYIIDPL